jgi:hypothetical protein
MRFVSSFPIKHGKYAITSLLMLDATIELPTGHVKSPETPAMRAVDSVVIL